MIAMSPWECGLAVTAHGLILFNEGEMFEVFRCKLVWVRKVCFLSWCLRCWVTQLGSGCVIKLLKGGFSLSSSTYFLNAICGICSQST